MVVNGFASDAAAQSDSGSPAETGSVRGVGLSDVIRVVIKSPCFDKDTLAEEVEQWLSRDSVDGRISVIQVRASQGVLSFSIDVRGQQPTVREFPALPRDCAEQRGAIALSIALAIDALESDLPPALAPRAPRFQWSPYATLTSGIPSAVGLGGGLGFEWRPGSLLSLRLGITGATSVAEQTLNASTPFAYATRLLSTRADACFRSGSNPGWETVACLGYWLGDFRTRGADRFGGLSQSHIWYAVSGSAELRWASKGGLGVLLGVDLIAPLRTIKLAVDTSTGERHASRVFPWAVGAVRVGPTLSF